MMKHGYDQRFCLLLCNTAVPMLCLFELSCILHTGVSLRFTVRDYFFQADSAEGSFFSLEL